MQLIEISGVTGTGLYDIYLCDITLTYCYLMLPSVTIPPTQSFYLPSSLPNIYPPPATISFENADSVIVKIIDVNSGCEIFKLYTCDLFPTPTPTLTPTPTSTPSNCKCITVTNSTIFTGSFYYTNCSGVTVPPISISPGLTLYFCGSNPVIITSCSATVGSPCVSGVCP